MINQKPMVSVVMATFDRADLILQAIDSVLKQSFSDLELIVIDDGSTDNTQALIEEKYKNEPRLRYVYQENTGQSGARNHGLTYAVGNYICFIDSDNLWLPNKLEVQLKVFASNPDVDIVYGDIITIDETGKELHRNNMRRLSGYIAGDLMKDNFVSMNTALARRECFETLGGMSGQVAVADDYDLWLRFSSQYKYLYVEEYFAKYRVMANQISSDKTRRFQSTEAIVKKFINDYPSATSSKQKSIGLAHLNVRKAYYLIAVKQYKAAIATSVKAIMYRPVYFLGYRVLLKSILCFLRLVN